MYIYIHICICVCVCMYRYICYPDIYIYVLYTHTHICTGLVYILTAYVIEWGSEATKYIGRKWSFDTLKPLLHVPAPRSAPTSPSPVRGTSTGLTASPSLMSVRSEGSAIMVLPLKVRDLSSGFENAADARILQVNSRVPQHVENDVCVRECVIWRQSCMHAIACEPF